MGAAPEPLLTVPEVATWLRLSVKATYRMAEEGRLPAIRVSNRLRFDPRAIRAWLDKQNQEDKWHRR